MPHVFYPDLKRTSVAIAVDFLAEKMPDCVGPATIMLTPTQFPEYSIRNLVSLWSASDANGSGIAAGMASADFFTASRAISQERERYPIEELDGAQVDELKNITCTNGTHLYDVRLEPTTLRGELSPGEWRVLEYCIAMHEGKVGDPERIKCYPELATRLVGFSQSLKVVMGYIRDNQTEAKPKLEPSLNIETLRSALRMMGLRRPKHGVYAPVG